MAHNEGADIHNYTKASNIQETSSGLGIDLYREDKYIGSVNANSVILATGAWNNQWSGGSLVKPTKGIHRTR